MAFNSKEWTHCDSLTSGSRNKQNAQNTVTVTYIVENNNLRTQETRGGAGGLGVRLGEGHALGQPSRSEQNGDLHRQKPTWRTLRELPGLTRGRPRGLSLSRVPWGALPPPLWFSAASTPFSPYSVLRGPFFSHPPCPRSALQHGPWPRTSYLALPLLTVTLLSIFPLKNDPMSCVNYQCEGGLLNTPTAKHASRAAHPSSLSDSTGSVLFSFPVTFPVYVSHTHTVIYSYMLTSHC